MGSVSPDGIGRHKAVVCGMFIKYSVHPGDAAFGKPSPHQRRQSHQTDHPQQSEPGLLGVADVRNFVQMPTMRALGQAVFSQCPRLKYIGRLATFADVRVTRLIE